MATQPSSRRLVTEDRVTNVVATAVARAIADEPEVTTAAAALAQSDAKLWRIHPTLTNGANLNTITVPGIYQVPTYSIANSLVNRPSLEAAIDPAIVEVMNTPFGDIHQRWTTLSDVTADAPVMIRRRTNGGNWSAWVALATADQAYRSVMRTVTTLASADATVLDIRLYRYGATVTAYLRKLQRVGSSAQVMLLTPADLAGFLPVNTAVQPIGRFASGNYTPGGEVIVHETGLFWRPLGADSGSLYSQVSWMTVDAWPS